MLNDINNWSHLLTNFCDSCVQPDSNRECGAIFGGILAPMRCPPALSATHQVCPFCLELHSFTSPHQPYCLFHKHNLNLNAGGWSTPASQKVLKLLKSTSRAYRKPTVNLIRVLLDSLNLESYIVVPVPMGSTSNRNRWQDSLEQAVAQSPGVEVLPLIGRNKQQSTKASVAQMRTRIVQEEYFIDKPLSHRINGMPVVLIDDNVTTGITMTHCATLLQAFNPVEILPLAIERNLPPRSLQRCPLETATDCSQYRPKSNHS